MTPDVQVAIGLFIGSAGLCVQYVVANWLDDRRDAADQKTVGGDPR